MARTTAITHVAMSVAPGSLTDDYRSSVLDFYGKMFGRRELEALRLPDRLTILVSANSYINLRERAELASHDDYEHFGVLVRSSEEIHHLWSELAAHYPEIALEPLAPTANGFLTFRFRHLLPFAIEVQYFPPAP